MKKLKKISDVPIGALDFVSIGMSCHALCVIHQEEILDKLLRNGIFPKKLVKKYKNPHLINAALVTLSGTNVIQMSDGAYRLTSLGREIAKSISLFTLPFIGYRKLLYKQTNIINDPKGWSDKDIDHEAVALSSIDFGKESIDPILTNIIRHIDPRGTICDLGCGAGQKLLKLCSDFRLDGLGIDKDLKALGKSKSKTKEGNKIEFIQADIRKINGVWEDVEVALISFVLHDISSEEEVLTFLNSLKNHFPRLRCLVIVDIVSLSETVPSIFPGFDYVHGLQGITPRNYEETKDLFDSSLFKCVREDSVPRMPNTFVWTLEPKKQ